MEKSNDLIGIQTRDLLACSIVPQPTTLPRAPYRYIIRTLYKQRPEPADVRPHAGLEASANRVTSFTS
jgi:hypothetical protein